MEFIQTPLEGLYLIKHQVIRDERGWFARTYCKEAFEEINFTSTFVQFNHSFNSQKGILRGMHFQKPPFAETKLIKCISGEVYDVAVDLRSGSSTFLQHFATILSPENITSILIPEGFAHGFQTLQENSALVYHHTQYYTKESEAGLRHDDPELKINWPLPVIYLSEKDAMHPLIDDNFKGLNL